jgi:hypothetical protein
MNKENRPAADGFPTGDEDPGGSPATSASPNVWEHQFFGEFGRLANMGPHPSGEQDVECAAYIVDNTKGQYASLQSHIVTPGVAGSELVVKYSPSTSSPAWADLVALPLNTANAVVPRISMPLLMPSAAKVKNLLLKLIRRGGNGTVTPEMWNAIIQATSARPPTVPSGGPEPPLPEDATWGAIVWDGDAANPLNSDVYGDGDDVNTIFDASPTGYDATTTATLLLPKYRKTGWAGSLPCFEWDGMNTPLNVQNPTQGLGNWTYYLLIENLDGGDNAPVWSGVNGYPFGYNMWATGSTICAQVNTNAFTGTECCATDTWGMGDRHIYRWSKDSGAVHWSLWVDGIKVCDNSANPQGNDTTLVEIMNAGTGLGMSGRIARIVAYNKNHNTSVAVGTPADGKTLPETILSAYWGTP